MAKFYCLIIVLLVTSMVACENESSSDNILPESTFEFFPRSGVFGDTVEISVGELQFQSPTIHLGDSLVEIIPSHSPSIISFVVPFIIDAKELSIRLEDTNAKFVSANKFNVLDPNTKAIDGYTFLLTNEDRIPLIIAHESGANAYFFGDKSLDNINGLLLETHTGLVYTEFDEESRVESISAAEGTLLFENYREDTVDIASIDSFGKIVYHRDFIIPGLHKLLESLQDETDTGGRLSQEMSASKAIRRALFVFDAVSCVSGIFSPIPLGLLASAAVVSSCAGAVNFVVETTTGKGNEFLQSSEFSVLSRSVSLAGKLDSPYALGKCLTGRLVGNVLACFGDIVAGTLQIADDWIDPPAEKLELKEKAKEGLAQQCNLSSNASIDTDGTITLTASNGVPPYNFTLDDSQVVQGATNAFFVDQQGGVHTYTISDAVGCTITRQTTLADPDPCQGIEITFDVDMDSEGTILISNWHGGSPPFEFSVNNSPFQSQPGFENNPDGSYSIKIRDSKGCEDGRIVNLTRPTVPCSANLALTATADNLTIIASAAGGSPPYEFSIDGEAFQAGNSFGNLQSGSYRVYVRDSEGCVDTKDITITEETTCPSSDLVASAVVSGSQITVSASGGKPPYSYSLDGALPLTYSNYFYLVAEGAHVVKVVDAAGCEFDLPVIVSRDWSLIPQSSFPQSGGFESCDPSSSVCRLGGSEYQDVELSELSYQLSGWGTPEKPISGLITVRYVDRFYWPQCSHTLDEVVTINIASLYTQLNANSNCGNTLCYGYVGAGNNPYPIFSEVTVDKGYNMTIVYVGTSVESNGTLGFSGFRLEFRKEFDMGCQTNNAYFDLVFEIPYN